MLQPERESRQPFCCSRSCAFVESGELKKSEKVVLYNGVVGREYV
jgi:hypothetical protein